MKRAAAAAVLATLLGTGLASASPRWSSPARLSTSARALEPELAVSPNGRALAVWDREEGAECAASPASLGCVHIVTARSLAPEWGPELEVNRPGVGAEPRAAINDAGDEALIWIHDIGADRVVQATYRRSGSVAFPEPNDLSEVVRRVTSHGIGLDRAGDAFAVWTEHYADGTSAVRAASRSAVSGVWTGAATLSTPGGTISAGPHLVVTPGGGAFAVWIENGRVRFSWGCGCRLTGSWDPTQTLSAPDGEAAGEVAIAATDQSGLAAIWVWRDSPRGTWRIQGTRRPQGLRLPTVDLEPVADAQAADPRLAPDGHDNVVAVWVDGSAAGRLRSAVSDGTTGRWSDISTVAEDVAEPRLAVDARGDAVAVWATPSAAIEAAVRPDAADVWQPPFTLVPTGGSHVRVGLDDAGRATAVWSREAPQGVAVESSNLPDVNELSLANTRLPAIRGAAHVGGTLICDRGVWEGTVPIRYIYQWLRSGRLIAAAHRNRYRVSHRDAGTSLACRVTAQNFARSLTVTSLPVRVRR